MAPRQFGMAVAQALGEAARRFRGDHEAAGHRVERPTIRLEGLDREAGGELFGETYVVANIGQSKPSAVRKHKARRARHLVGQAASSYCDWRRRRGLRTNPQGTA